MIILLFLIAWIILKDGDIKCIVLQGKWKQHIVLFSVIPMLISVDSLIKKEKRNLTKKCKDFYQFRFEDLSKRM